MISYYCRSCWGTQGGQCEVTLDDTMNDVCLCPVSGEAEAEWIANSIRGSESNILQQKKVSIDKAD